jgi:transposase-like protein
MPRCPICDSPRVIIVLNETRRGLCARCGARWTQDGDTQRQVEPPASAEQAGQRTGAR